MKKRMIIKHLSVILFTTFAFSCGISNSDFQEVETEIEEFQKLSCITKKGLIYVQGMNEKLQEHSSTGNMEEMQKIQNQMLQYNEKQAEVNSRISELNKILMEFGSNLDETKKKEMEIVLLLDNQDCMSYEDFLNETTSIKMTTKSASIEEIKTEEKKETESYDGWMELKKFNEEGAVNYFSVTNKDKEFTFDIIVPLTSYFEKDREANTNVLGYVYKQVDTDFYYLTNQRTMLGIQVSVPAKQYKEVIKNAFSVEGISDEIKSLYGIGDDTYVTFYDTKENKYIDAQEVGDNLRLKGNSIFAMKNLMCLVGLNDSNWEQNEIDLFKKELSSYNFRKANYTPEFKDGLSSGRYQIQVVKTANKYFDKNNAPLRMLQVSGTLLQAEKMTQNYYQITLLNGQIENNKELNSNTKESLKTVKMDVNDFDKLALGEMPSNKISESFDEDVNKDIETPEEVVQYYKINDPDGYSNLRDAPKGNVLQKVYEKERFTVISSEGDYQKVKLDDGTIGFIHKSRVQTAK